MHNYVTLNEQVQKELVRIQKKREEDKQEIKNLHEQDFDMTENYQAQIDLLQQQLKQNTQRQRDEHTKKINKRLSLEERLTEEKRLYQSLKEKQRVLEKNLEKWITKEKQSSHLEKQPNTMDIHLHENKNNELVAQCKLKAIELELKKIKNEKKEKQLEIEKVLKENKEKQDQVLNLEEKLVNSRFTQKLPWETKLPWENNEELGSKYQANTHQRNPKKRRQSLIPTLKTPRKISSYSIGSTPMTDKKKTFVAKHSKSKYFFSNTIQ